MTTALMPNPKQQYFFAAGIPLVGGKIYTYAAGTNTPKQTFTDFAGTIPQANPIILNARGEPASAIFWSGNYKVEIRDALNNLIYTVDNYNSDPNGVGTFLTNIANTSSPSQGAALIGRAGQVVNSISDLRNLIKTSPSKYAFVSGYYASGDGGGGNYYLDAADTTTADNGGTVIVANDGGRWKLWGQDAWVSIKQFGAKMDDSTPDHIAVQAAINWVMSLPTGGAVYVPVGTARLGALINIPTITSKAFTMFGDGAMSKFRSISAPGMFVVGDNTAKFGSTYLFRDFAVVQPVAGNVTGLQLKNLNSVRVEGCIFSNVQSGIVLENTYDARISGCTFYGCPLYGITTLTSGTNGTKIFNNDFGFCGVAVNLAGPNAVGPNGNNIVISNNDFEVNQTSVAMFSYTSVKIDGNYIEGGSGAVFSFSGVNASIDITQNWLGQNAVPTNFQSIIAGKLSGNTISQSTWTASTTQDFFIGRNTLFGAAFVPATPWAAPALINGFSNTGGVWTVAGYIRDEEGFVTCRGMVQAAADNIAFVLPTGYQPSAQQTFASVAANGNLTRATVFPNGNVTVVRGADTTCDLSCIRFQAIS